MKKGQKKLTYQEVMDRFYTHLSDEDLAHEEWR